MKEITRPYEIEAWIGFNFPGRRGQYSSQNYHWQHFSGTDYNARNHRNAIYKIKKDWSTSVDKELGNYDYLMFADVDYQHPEVKEDVKNWGLWITKELKIQGIRFDAVKHFSEEFLREFIDHLDKKVGTGWFMVGEFWKDSLESMLGYLERMQYRFSLFDCLLVFNFSNISKEKGADLRKVFRSTLVKHRPDNAVVSLDIRQMHVPTLLFPRLILIDLRNEP